MIRTILLSLLTITCTLRIRAQDSRYAGTWICHTEETRGSDHYVWDSFIRIDIEDSHVYVRLKLVGKDADGRDFQTRKEGENVMINSDGTISFDEYLSKSDYDQDDRLYWTVWYHYVAKYEGGRLNVSKKRKGEGRNSNGYLIKDEKDVYSVKYMIYYNEKDNW